MPINHPHPKKTIGYSGSILAYADYSIISKGVHRVYIFTALDTRGLQGMLVHPCTPIL